MDTLWDARLPCARSMHRLRMSSFRLIIFAQVINQSRYNKSVDWYALGVLIFEMLTGVPPFHKDDSNMMALYQRIQQGPSCVHFPSEISLLAKDLILRLLDGDPTKRLGNLRKEGNDVFEHRWFQEVDWNKLRNREITAPYLPKIAGDGDASA